MNEIATIKSIETAPASRNEAKIKDYLQSPIFIGEAQKLLGSKDLAQRLARCAITCIYTQNAKQRDTLLSSDPASLVQVILSLAEIDLEPGRDAYLISRKGVIGASIRWEGYVRAARLSGQIRRVWADVIREGDEYAITAGSAGSSISHSWKLGTERGEIVGAYACAEWMDGTVETVVKDRDYINRCKAASDNRMDGNPWSLWPDQMAMAKVVKLLCKRLPLGRPEKTHTSTVIENLDADGLPPDYSATMIEEAAPAQLPAAKTAPTTTPRPRGRPRKAQPETTAAPSGPMTEEQASRVMDLCGKRGIKPSELDPLCRLFVDGADAFESLDDGQARRLLACLGEPDLVAAQLGILRDPGEDQPPTP